MKTSGMSRGKSKNLDIGQLGQKKPRTSHRETKKIRFSGGLAGPSGPKPMPELRIPLTAGAFSLRYNGKR
jgi:hypothetical protein